MAGAAVEPPPSPRELPPIPETRAVRYEIVEGATCETFCADLTRIASHGFNTVIVSAFRHGRALFPCESLQRMGMSPARRWFRNRDPFGEVLRLADRLGLRVLGHVEALNVGSARDGGPGPILRRRPDWCLRRRSRRLVLTGADEHRYFLDPSNRDARRLIGDVFYELAERYPVGGIYFNDLRYPRGLADLDQGRFVRDVPAFIESKGATIGRDALSFATRSSSSRELFLELQAWRNEQLNEVLHYLHCRLERANNRLWIVTQAVGPYDAAVSRESLQGDWGVWLTRQYVDGAAPLCHAETVQAFEAALRADAAWIPDDRALYPLIEPQDLESGAGRIAACRRLGLAGFIFRSFHRLQDAHWTRLKELMERPARPTEDQPYANARRALAECQRLLARRVELAELFRDVLKVLPEQPGPRGKVLNPNLSESIANNLRAVERAVADGSLELAPDERDAARWIAVARRCLALALRH